MPATKKAAAAADEPKHPDKVTDPTSRREAILAETNAAVAAINAERNAAQALRDAEGAALINQRKAVKPDPNGTIDQRMAALEQDHIRMGARPARNA